MTATIITLNNLKEFLTLAKSVFGLKSLATKHRTALDSYILNIDYENELAFDTDLIVSGGASSATLGVGQLGTMILGSA